MAPGGRDLDRSRHRLRHRLLDATLRPYIVAFQSLPKVAVAPIIVMWFGYDLTSKVVMVCLLTFFPVLVNSMAGFRAADPERIELLRARSASPWQIFWKVKFPSALPYIFAGLDIAAVFAVVGAIVGEFVGAQLGLGVQLLSMNAAMDTAGSFSVFIILSAMGLALNQIIRRVQRKMLLWAPSKRRNAPPMPDPQCQRRAIRPLPPWSHSRAAVPP